MSWPAFDYRYLAYVALISLPLIVCLIILIVPRLRSGPKWKLVKRTQDHHKKLSTPAGHAFAYLTALAGFMIFVPISVLTLLLVGWVVGVVDNPAVHPVLFEGTPNALRSWLELCYFGANIVVAGVAWFAVRFAADQARQARKQADEAEHSRAAQVYLQITGRFISEALSYSRVLSAHVIRGFDPAKTPDLTLGEFFHNAVNPKRTSLDLVEVQAYMKHLEILAFFEDVGVLVKQRYVQLEDIRLLFRGVILTTKQIFEHHILERRRAEGTPNLFQNFLELCESVAEPPSPQSVESPASP